MHARFHQRPWSCGASAGRMDIRSTFEFPQLALTGFDPAEHPRIGFTYAIADREIGVHTFSCGPEFPYRDDPSLWATLELVK